MSDFLRGLPKAELHVHVEGTLEPELAVRLARRNGIRLRAASVTELRAAYDFADLPSFLEVYEDTARVLRTEEDFFELTAAYLRRAVAHGVRRAEIFFDPQMHAERGVAMPTMIAGIAGALEQGWRELGISSGLIMCILRDRSPDAAMSTLEQALPLADQLLGVGLDSAEVGNPPERFVDVFARARAAGLRAVAHAGEEGPPEYVRQALDLLHAERIDHGVRAAEDAGLLRRLAREQVPLTVCPLSNVRLGVFERLEDHNLPLLLDAGVAVTINSDDPAYFGGYIADAYAAAQQALGLTDAQMASVARTSLQATFLSDAERQDLLTELDAYVARSLVDGAGL